MNGPAILSTVSMSSGSSNASLAAEAGKLESVETSTPPGIILSSPGNEVTGFPGPYMPAGTPGVGLPVIHPLFPLILLISEA
jgi:hypothetical protein